MPKSAKLAPPLEAEIAEQVVAAAAIYGVVLERQNTGVGSYPNRDGSTRRVRFGAKGNPDWKATLPGGRELGVEVKRPGKRPTPEQLDRLRKLNEAGAVGLWTDDAVVFARLLPKILAGARVEIDPDGTPYVVSEE